MENIQVPQDSAFQPETEKEGHNLSGPAMTLVEMAKTFEERNAVYGSNWQEAGAALEALTAKADMNEVDWNSFHLFMLIVVKLSRFANSNFTHTDSIHDAAVYAAMIESIIEGK